MRALWPSDKPVKAERKGQVRLDFAEAKTGLQSKQQDVGKRPTFPKVSAEKACFLCRTEGHGSAENPRKVSETKITEKYFIHLFRVYVEFLEVTVICFVFTLNF